MNETSPRGVPRPGEFRQALAQEFEAYVDAEGSRFPAEDCLRSIFTAMTETATNPMNYGVASLPFRKPG